MGDCAWLRKGAAGAVTWPHLCVCACECVCVCCRSGARTCLETLQQSASWSATASLVIAVLWCSKSRRHDIVVVAFTHGSCSCGAWFLRHSCFVMVLLVSSQLQKLQAVLTRS